MFIAPEYLLRGSLQPADWGRAAGALADAGLTTMGAQKMLARLAKNSYVKTGWSVFMLFPVRKDRRYFKIQGNFLGGIDALKK
ncbi:MAG TPA: hypothetical protein VKV29_07560 [Chthonomonas sp.]|jgi:hypothetical protein|uniref:hypothetical protein n=1 Tax=Chthonomonas sp. TaxID=2282153 RepID=UPI002B4B47E2|nr:hypothetical protein [Chthonomonas sp.]HLH80125.1 hypothetical protein [Chthonomonas sp.]